MAVRLRNILISAMQDVSRAGPVVPHRGARISMTSRDLDVPEVGSCVETGRERFTNHAEWVSVTTGR
jgi:hypothetical protein